jgi:hypothetical protein
MQSRIRSVVAAQEAGTESLKRDDIISFVTQTPAPCNTPVTAYPDTPGETGVPPFAPARRHLRGRRATPSRHRSFE